MNIGQAADRSGVTPKTIRYYESVGLIEAAPRSDNGYRDYGVDDVETLRFISRARGLGFTVAEVRALLSLYHDRERASAEVKAMTQAHIRDIDRKVAELDAMRSTLPDMVDCCAGDARPDCPILDDLAGRHT